MLHGAGGTGGSPSISMSPSCCRHVSFFMLICPFLMLSPSFSYAPWRRWDGGVSFHLHVSILLSTRFFFYANLSFFYAVSLFFLCSMAQVGRGGSPSISMSPSCCRHVSFFMLVCPFFMLSPSFSYAPWRRWDRGVSFRLHVSILLSTRFFFYANLSFFYAVSLFFLCSMAQVGRGVSFHLHVSILLSTRFFFYANLSFFYAVSLFFLCSMAQVGRGGLLPSPCLHPVVDTFLFLC